MASWVLVCSQCNAEFSHSEISESGYTRLYPFTLNVTKPELPPDGVTICSPEL